MENENLPPAEESAQTSEAFLDGWDDAESSQTKELSAEPPAEPPVTEPPAEPPAEPPVTEPPAEPAAEPAAEPPKTWILRHLEEEKTVSEPELTALAQKGLDYDRVREKYAAAKPIMELFSQISKDSGMSVEDYIAFVRTEAKKSGGMTEEEAKRAVSLEDREAAVHAKEAADKERRDVQNRQTQQKSSAQERRSADIAEFQQTFPDAAKDANAIPAEVWQSVQRGQRLSVAYALWLAKQAETEAEKVKRDSASKEQNTRNAERSTGSMKTAGSENKARDPFLEGFDS